MTMFFEQRTQPRFVADNLTAHITVKPPSADKKITVNGKLIDMSYTGIKIRLNTPLPDILDYGEIKIVIMLPQSGIPISIQGIIRHDNEKNEYGVQFSDQHKQQTVDRLMFECIKQARQSVQLDPDD